MRVKIDHFSCVRRKVGVASRVKTNQEGLAMLRARPPTSF
jgi:hypothetical protein